MRVLEDALEQQSQARLELEARLQDVQVEAEFKLKDTHASVANMRKQLARANSERFNAEQNLEQEKAQSRRYQERGAGAEQGLGEVREALRRAEDDKARLGVELAELRRLVDTERNNSAGVRQREHETRDRLLEAERGMKLCQSEAMAVENRITAELRMKDQEIENLTGEIRSMKDQLVDRSRNAQSKDEALVFEQDKLLTAEKRIREYQQENADLRKQISLADNRVDEVMRQSGSISAVKSEVQDLLHQKERELQQEQGRAAATERRLREDQQQVLELQRQLQAKSDENLALRRREQELESRHNLSQREVSGRIDSLRAEKEALEHDADSSSRTLRDQQAAALDRERGYKKTIAGLQEKCARANENLAKFEEFNNYNTQLRDNNTRLREELNASQSELEVSKSQVLDLQSRLQRLSRPG